MVIRSKIQSHPVSSRSAFSLVEALIGMAVVGVLVVSLYSGMTTGLTFVRLSREQLRATQVILERMEAIRVFNWDQLVNSNGYVPATFLAPFQYDGTTNVSAGGLTYTGTVTIAAMPGNRNYTNDMRMITVGLTWQSNGQPRSRSISTYVSRYGIQNKLFY